MIDATSSLPLPTSTDSDPRPNSSSNSNSSEGDVFPFLVHSQYSVTNGEPPEVDNGKLARQKRRRTSAEDQATLEAEYKQNPKPDKAARLEIVKRVSLGEKEVQIWFQNRRQNTRRKSRPLLPHEIAAFGLGGMAALSSDAVSRNPLDGTSDQNHQHPSDSEKTLNSSQETWEPLEDGSHVSKDVPVAAILTRPEKDPRITLGSISSSKDVVEILTKKQTSHQIARTEHTAASRSDVSSQLLPNTLGYLSNRRNATSYSIIHPTTTQVSKHGPPIDPRLFLPSSFLRGMSAENCTTQSSSQVRLSMSLDGKAELVSSYLSPQRPKALPPLPSSNVTSKERTRGLKRSYSAIPLGHVARKSSSNLPITPRIPTGRSRDARTWEFCCDTDTRDELTTQAENESNGSAIAAISLLRSTSNSTLKPNANKRNASTQRIEARGHSKKAKLARSSSSFARLQGSGKIIALSPSGDSDKENWLPSEEPGSLRRQEIIATRPPKQRRRRVLEESTLGQVTTSDVIGLNNLRKSVIPDQGILENNDVEANPEVERFMRGEVSPSKKGDLDCIQGLLSLSQGTWR